MAWAITKQTFVWGFHSPIECQTQITKKFLSPKSGFLTASTQCTLSLPKFRTMALFVLHTMPGIAFFSRLMADGAVKFQWMAMLVRCFPKTLIFGIFSLLIWVESFKMTPIPQQSGWPVVAFIALFLFRYTRFVVHILAYLFYRPTPVPNYEEGALHNPSDVTVLVASVEPEGRDFERTIYSTLATGCAEIIVVTIEKRFEEARLLCESISSRIRVLSSAVANKRMQLSAGLAHVQTDIVVFADDHVWFSEPPAFLQSVLAPFQNPTVGAVAVGKRVERVQGLKRFSFADMLNFIACLYLERHNFDLAASNTIDGGVFVISGRTAAYRSSIVCSPEFVANFLNEIWFFGIGPLHADDDNCMTRWLVNEGWKIKFQHSPTALMHTSLGVGGFRKYQCQCLRWVRTTWRSNATSLFRDGVVWQSQPWCVYAVYLSSFFNFALFTDVALVILGHAAIKYVGLNTSEWMTLLLGWILGSKAVKILPHFVRNPRDVVYFPVYILFAYYHSLIKIWALFTVHSLSWGSRPNVVA